MIPITHNLDPIKLLTDDATIAGWNNEGLPSDRMSTENAIILTNSDRWPLIIDPQVQVSFPAEPSEVLELISGLGFRHL